MSVEELEIWRDHNFTLDTSPVRVLSMDTVINTAIVSAAGPPSHELEVGVPEGHILGVNNLEDKSVSRRPDVKDEHQLGTINKPKRAQSPESEKKRTGVLAKRAKTSSFVDTSEDHRMGAIGISRSAVASQRIKEAMKERTLQISKERKSNYARSSAGICLLRWNMARAGE